MLFLEAYLSEFIKLFLIKKMRTIDFLSIAPQTFIFQKSSNKTTFGGFLTLIYGLIVLIMAIIYYIDYHINDKYIISYSRYQKNTDRDERKEKSNDTNYNPTLTFKFDVKDFNQSSLSQNFLLLDYINKTLIDRNTSYNYNVSNMMIIVLYNCSDPNCHIREEDYSINNKINLMLYFTFWRKYYKYDLQDDYEQSKLSNDFSYFRIGFNPDIPQGADYFSYYNLLPLYDNSDLNNYKEQISSCLKHYIYNMYFYRLTSYYYNQVK